MWTWAKAVLVFLGVIEKGEELIHDHNVEVGGENKHAVADLTAVVKQDAAAIKNAEDVHGLSDSALDAELRAITTGGHK